MPRASTIASAGDRRRWFSMHRSTSSPTAARNWRTAPRPPAEELVDGGAEVLAGDVPEGDVDGAEGAHDGGAAEVGGAVEVLPVVLDAERVLADQVAAEFAHDGCGRLEEPPGAGLAEPDQPGV